MLTGTACNKSNRLHASCLLPGTVNIVIFHAGPHVEAARSGPVEAAGSLAAAAYLGLEENADEAGAASQSGQVCPPFNAPLLDST